MVAGGGAAGLVAQAVNVKEMAIIEHMARVMLTLPAITVRPRRALPPILIGEHMEV